MITAVDTNVLLDIFAADRKFGELSSRACRRCIDEGGLLACEVVWAELAGFFPTVSAVEKAMKRLGVEFSAIDQQTSLTAGVAWRRYRLRGGKCQRVVADFLIGAHAIAGADRLLTRDRGFYRAYFRRLRVMDPAAD